MNDSPEEKRIIIDEDWKSQVEREREEQRHQGEAEGSAANHGSYDEQLPPASFAFLVQSIVTQIFAALGQFPDPGTNERTVSLSYAKLNIDLLEILQLKTQGNLTGDETALLEDALHHSRMLFISVRDALQRQAEMNAEGGTPSASSKIVT